jgi:hypothetical protein
MNVRAALGVIAGLGTMIAVAVPAHADALRWSGEVDDTATIRIRQRDVRTNANRNGISNARYDVNGRLPQVPVRVSLNREAGRGDIRIVEQPSARNNYTAVIRIKDNQAGKGRYAFNLQWNNPRTAVGNGNGKWNNGRWNNGRRP